MPWTTEDVDKHKKGLTTKQKKKWVTIANAVLKSCQEKNGENCDVMAIRTANSRVTVNEMVMCNNEAKEYTTREETLNGRTYIVVPVTMMVEGVHQGSHGPLLHTAEELGKIPASWNGIPVTVGHPVVDDSFVSANSPEVLEEWAIGIVFNTEMFDSRLKSEAWIEKDKLEANENLSARINNGEIIEVSVGVFSEDEQVEGKWGTEVYSAIAKNLRPDHLALLPNQVGACSVEDGCGIRVNNQNKTEKIMDVKKEILTLQEQGYSIALLALNSDEGLQEKLDALRELVRSKNTNVGDSYTWCYLIEAYDDNIVYEESSQTGTHYFKQNYQKDLATESYVFVGEPVQVVRKVEYETVQNNQDTGIKRKRTTLKKEDIMTDAKCTSCVKKKVNELIANTATRFAETDREWLETLEESQLDQMIPKENESITPEMAVNALQPTLKTEEDYINLMPTAMQTTMRAALSVHNNRKTALVDQIIANTEEGTWTKEELEVYAVEKLEKIAKTASVQVNNYAGLSAGGNLQVNAKDDVPALAPAGINFESK